MKVAYLGNFEPEHSTENHVYRALAHNDHEVMQFQENVIERWAQLTQSVSEFDLILWTRTGWPNHPKDMQLELLRVARNAGVPVVGYHLDRWWGLNRAHEVTSEPFFKADLVITADGDPGHQLKFEAAGVNHVWFPPGVSLHECLRVPQDNPQYAHDIVFVGSHLEYHKEWRYRMQLVNWLRNTYRHQITFYPIPGEHALRGQPLVDLYHNAKVVVGDSCLNGGIKQYWSDRIPETLGRRGYLIHPEVEGLSDHFTPGGHLDTYELGNWPQLKEAIDRGLSEFARRDMISAAGQAHVLEYHTYEVRMVQLMNLLREREMI